MLVWSMCCGFVLLLGLIGIKDTRVFRKNCSVTTIRFAKTKIPTSVQLFCDCGLLSVLREAEMGRCASDLPLFRASIHVLTPAVIRNRKKVAILGVFLFLGTRIGLMLGAWAGWPGRGAGILPVAQRGRLDALDNAMP